MPVFIKTETMRNKIKPFNLVVLSLFINAFLTINLPAQNQTNLLSKKLGARVVDYSSNYHSEMIEDAAWDVSSLIAGVTGGPADELPVWCTGTGAEFPHLAVIELPKSTWLTTFVFNNYIFDEQSYPGISAKNIRIEISNTGAKEGFEPVASFVLERNKNDQEVRIAPQQGRWIKIVITDNWGNPTWTELGQLNAYDDGSRPTDIATQLTGSGVADVYGIYFDFASATLRPESGKTLAEIATLLNANSSLQLIVEGHTDDVGDEQANQKLSEARAQAVCRALVQRGVDGSRLEAVGYGESKPIVDNDTPIGRAQNRRVTLRKKAV